MFLVDSFKDYSRYALISLRSGQDDARLPKVFEALVLVCEGLCSMGLAVQARRDKGKGRETEKGGDEDVVKAMKNEREGLIEPLIGKFPLHPFTIFRGGNLLSMHWPYYSLDQKKRSDQPMNCFSRPFFYG